MGKRGLEVGAGGAILSGARFCARGSSVVTLSLALAVPTSASAQSAPPIVRPPTREEVTRPDLQPPPPPPSRIDVEGAIERAPCALDNPQFSNIRVTLRSVEFEGLQRVSAEALRPAYANLVGHEQPISIVCDVRDRAATILRQAGYIASVEVPEQRIADGVIHFKVLMAKMVQVRVRGDASGAERTIAGYLGRLTEQPVFNRFDAERYLLLASDLPGYNVRLTLVPAGTAPGEVIGEVTVRRIAAMADANIQNYGSRELGRWGGLLRGQVFGLTGLGDRTTAAVFSTSDFREQQTVQLGHDFHLGSEGLGISDNFTYAWARPSVGGGADVRARTLLATVAASYPFIRRQSHTVRGDVGFDFINQDVKIDGIDLTRDRLRVAFLRATADAVSLDYSHPGTSVVEPLWRFNGQVELRHGLDVFGATGDCGPTGANCLGVGDVPPSHVEGDATATVLRGSAYGEYRPLALVTLALGARGQVSGKPLLSFEEFSAGNYTVGRGYDPGSLLGDSGIGVQAELRVGSQVPAGDRAVALEGYGFFDYSRVSNEDRLFVTDQAKRLSSVGGGVRAVWDRFNLDLALAIPLKRVGLLNEKPDPRLLVSLSTRLWPWSFR
jgi:hemolysin activation/secretion protein